MAIAKVPGGGAANWKPSKRRHWLPTTMFLGLGAMCCVMHAQALSSKIEEQYQSEQDPVRKAKLLAKMGPLALERARGYLMADEVEQAVSTLEIYRDKVRQTASALDASGVNVRKHPGGFKELQIGLREFIRRLDDLIFSLPTASRPGLEAVRADLSVTERSLFERLFPTVAEDGGKKR